jgi:pyrimidine-nucleoside phosphorylase
MKQPRLKAELRAEKNGYLDTMDTETVGRSALLLGAGRARKEDDIDPSAGIRFLRKPGDSVAEGELIAYLYSDDEEKLADGTALLRSTLRYSGTKPTLPALIYARVSRDGVEEFH